MSGSDISGIMALVIKNKESGDMNQFQEPKT